MNVLAVGDSLTTEALAFASIVTALLLGMVLVLILRTRSLPVCKNCGFPSVRRVHSRHSPLDTLARGCFLYPHLCQRCLHRFYCFGSRRARRHSSSRSTAAGKS